MINQNILIYGGVRVEKIPVLGQWLQCLKTKIQIFGSHSNDFKYIRQNEVALHFFINIMSNFLLFLGPFGSNKGSLKCAGKSKFLDGSY